MIKKETKLENNQFHVTFNFSPEDVYHSRSNSKGTYYSRHVANGTTHRQGIWEGVEIVEVWTKTGDNAWRSHGASSSATVSTSDNNVHIQGKALYRLRTMGYHWNDFSGNYPFFWFGNFNSDPNKYAKGYFTDNGPYSPGNEHYYSVVPPDWSYKWCEWSDWAYNHGNTTNNWAISKGRYEQRNANHESAREDNGWIAESNNKQMWRKSMMFFFEKEFIDGVTSSGIATNPNVPHINVHPAKGDGGNITVQYTDNAGIPGKLWINVHCGDKYANVLTWDTSWIFQSGECRDIYVDFNNAFGEGYRGNDVYYEAIARNEYQYYSPNWTGKIGVQRYNGRPSVPTGLRIEGHNNIIYNGIKILWDGAWDPDGDWLVYDLWIKVWTREGQLIKDEMMISAHNNLQIDYGISNLPEGCTIHVFVRSSDCQIVSNWSDPAICTKGTAPKGNIVQISPSVSGNNLYNKRPRFVFDGYDNVSEFIVVVNGQEYSSHFSPHLFHHHGSKMVFKPDFDLSGLFHCYAFMRNQYGESPHSMLHYYAIKNPYENIIEGNIIFAKDVKQVQEMIADFGKAFNREFQYEVVDRGVVITAQIYNTCHNFMNSVLWDINNLTPGSPFEYALHCWPVEQGQINDDELWNKLVQELNNI